MHPTARLCQGTLNIGIKWYSFSDGARKVNSRKRVATTQLTKVIEEWMRDDFEITELKGS